MVSKASLYSCSSSSTGSHTSATQLQTSIGNEIHLSCTTAGGMVVPQLPPAAPPAGSVVEGQTLAVRPASAAAQEGHVQGAAQTSLGQHTGCRRKQAKPPYGSTLMGASVAHFTLQCMQKMSKPSYSDYTTTTRSPVWLTVSKYINMQTVRCLLTVR